MLASMNTNTILTGDCMALLPTLPAGAADLIYLDPPFNIGLDYPGYDDRRPEGEYLAWLAGVFEQLLRVLTPTGSLWVQIAPKWEAEVNLLLRRLGLYWRDTVIWYYTFGPSQSRKFTPAYQPLLYFTKDRQRLTFDADAVREPSARQTKYCDKRANPKGKVPDNVWRISRVCGTFRENLKDQGRPAEAEAAYRKALALKPDYAFAYNNRGIALTDQGRPAEAEAACRQAIALKPDYAFAYNNLGAALNSQGKPAEAEAVCREAIALKPDYALAYNNLGNALNGQGKHREAEAAYRRAIALKPDLAGAYYNLGIALKDQRRPAEAEAAYRKAIALKPDFADAYVNLGIALKDQGKPAEAEAACRQAIALKPDDAFAYSNLGNALNSQGKHREAEAAYREAIALKPDYAEAHCNLGNVLKNQDRFAESLVAFRRGHELGSKRPGWRYPSLQWVRDAERLVELDKKLPAILQGTMLLLLLRSGGGTSLPRPALATLLALVVTAGVVMPASSAREPEPKSEPLPLRACLPALREKALLENDREHLDVLQDLLARVKVLQEADVLPPAAVSHAERRCLQARIGLLRRQKDSLDALDQLQVRSDVKPERLKAVEEAVVAPIVRHLRRFDEIASGESAIEEELKKYLPPESAPRLRAGLLRQFTESALVKGTKFAGGVRGRWATWERFSDQELQERLQQLRRQQRELLDRKAELRAKHKLLSPDEEKHLAGAEAESNLGTFERLLRQYEADYTEAGKPKRGDQVGERRRMIAFRDVWTSAMKVLLEAHDEQLRVVREGWPKLSPIEVDKTALLTCDPEQCERVVALRVKAPGAAASTRANLRSVRLLAETYGLQQRLVGLSYQELWSLLEELQSPPRLGVAATGSPSAQALFEAELSRARAREELLRTWFDYQAARLALFSDLGAAPP
jgi:tetratricopeptide (TPR) repeat protein